MKLQEGILLHFPAVVNVERITAHGGQIDDSVQDLAAAGHTDEHAGAYLG